jgi:hypothetical protein
MRWRGWRIRHQEKLLPVSVIASAMRRGASDLALTGRRVRGRQPAGGSKPIGAPTAAPVGVEQRAVRPEEAPAPVTTTPCALPHATQEPDEVVQRIEVPAPAIDQLLRQRV